MRSLADDQECNIVAITEPLVFDWTVRNGDAFYSCARG